MFFLNNCPNLCSAVVKFPHMVLYEYKTGMYRYTHLPAFANYILNNHLDEFVFDQLRFSREVNLPLLRYLANYSDEHLAQFLKTSTTEYLTFLSQNQAKQHMALSFEKWQRDQVPIIGKSDITAEDITILYHMRGTILRKWVRNYQVDTEEKFELIEEIDNLVFGATTSATNIYIDILKEKIHDEAHFNAQLISTSPCIIFIFDVAKNKEIFINGKVKEIMGFTPEEVLDLGDRLLPSLTHPDDLQTLQADMQKILEDRNGKTHVLEYRFKHKDGEYRWIRTYSIVFRRDAEGRPTELLGTTFEISNEKEMALALAKREGQLLEAQAIGQIGSFEWDLVNDKSVHTPQMLNILEFAEQQPISRFMMRVHPNDREKVQQAIAQSFVTGKCDCQFRFITTTGEKALWVRAVVMFEHGKPVSMRGTVQDITALKRIEEELVKKTRELEKSNESLQQFASIASHDLKEPLRKMSMYSDMVLTLEEGNLSAASHLNLGKVKSSSLRMQSMIEDILSFSSITNQSAKQRSGLKEIVEEVIDILRDRVEEKKARITVRELPEADVIPGQMRQLFQNLIANALKFSKNDEHPEVHITHRFLQPQEVNDPGLAGANCYHELSISDNGIGFKQDDADKIFNLFSRLHSRESYEGSGLGLSICKRIVENHGGSIRAVSEPGRGSTFIVVIPARA